MRRRDRVPPAQMTAAELVAAVDEAGFGGRVAGAADGLGAFLASRGYDWLDLIKARCAVKVGRGDRPVLSCMRRLDGD